jgi:hypothetical protein
MKAEDWRTLLLAFYCLAMGVLLGVLWSLGSNGTDWGNASEKVTAFATAALAILTLGLLGMAWYQLSRQTYTQRQWATLQICDRYDSDPLIRDAVTTLRALSESGKTTKTDLQIDMACRLLFNYFDSIAIGLAQNLYLESLAYPHIGSIMLSWRKHIVTYQHPTVLAFLVKLSKSYDQFEALAARWEGNPPKEPN